MDEFDLMNLEELEKELLVKQDKVEEHYAKHGVKNIEDFAMLLADVSYIQERVIGEQYELIQKLRK